MTDLRVGDVVLPVEFAEYEGAFKSYDLRVTHVYKNGNIRAKTTSGDATWTGKADGFYVPGFAGTSP